MNFSLDKHSTKAGVQPELIPTTHCGIRYQPVTLGTGHLLTLQFNTIETHLALVPEPLISPQPPCLMRANTSTALSVTCDRYLGPKNHRL